MPTILPRRAMFLAAALCLGSLTGEALISRAAPPRSSRNPRTATPQAKRSTTQPQQAAKTPAPTNGAKAAAPSTAKPVAPTPQRDAEVAPVAKTPAAM